VTNRPTPLAAIVWRLLAAIALVLMPVGMSPAWAAPAASAASTLDHCADHGSQPRDTSCHSTDCAGCVAVTAFVAPIDEHLVVPAIPPYRAPADLRSGRISEIATPPPKAS
jgi:hypothetical protein